LTLLSKSSRLKNISKPKLALIIILLSVTVGWESYLVMGIPAPTTPAVIEPGSLKNACSYDVYLDSAAASPTTMIKNCVTGANDFSGATADIALQAMFNFIATVANANPAPPGGVPVGPQFVINFSPGNYYLASVVTINVPGTGGGTGITMDGGGDDRANIILNSGVNNDMFNVTSAGSIFQMRNMKLEGNKAGQSGISRCVEVNAAEIAFFHIELRDCLTDAIRMRDFNGGSSAWNVFQDVWILSCGTNGINVNPVGSAFTDFRITGSKFESCTNSIIFSNGNMADISIVGNNFNNAGINFNVGSTKQVAITGNVFYNAPTKVINYVGTGLGSLTNFNNVISGNEFQTGTGTNVAIYLADFVDGITVTSNQFAGYTSSPTVPVTLIQTHQKLTTLVTQNSGMGASWTGFGIVQPAVPATTVNQQNTNPYQVRIYISGAGTGITAYKVTDPSGTANTFTTTVTVGFTIELDPYAQVALTYTGSPTWLWFGEANLS